MKQKRCQSHIRARKAHWLPDHPEVANRWEQDCSRAIDAAILEMSRVRRSRLGRAAIASVKKMRDDTLAHALRSKKKGRNPLYGELFHLIEVARVVVENAAYAILPYDSSHDLDGFKRESREMADEFWPPALLLAQKEDSGFPS